MAHLPIATPGASSSNEPFTWFIYASSLDVGAMEAWCGDHGYTPPDLARAFPAQLEGFRLTFNVQSRFWGGAVANLAEAPGQRVQGLAVALPGSARKMVDHKEGAVSGLYMPVAVTVRPLAGGDGVPAVAYRGAANRVGPEQPPSPRFLEALLRGAERWHLDAQWMDQLRASGAR